MVMGKTLKSLTNRLLGKNEQEEGAKKAIALCVAAQKGGVGKTTTVVHLAAALALFHNLKVLVLDMDGQGHVALSMSHLLSESSQPKESLGELLLQKDRDVFELVSESQIPNLFLVPSDRKLHETESMMSTKIGRELLLKKAMRVARTHFDVILIDSPPNLGNLTLNSLVASDFVLVPCDMSTLSLDGVEGVLQAIENVQDTIHPNLQLLGLVRTRFDKRHKTMNETIGTQLEKKFLPWLFQTIVYSSTAVTKAQVHGSTLFQTDPQNQTASAYKELSCEIAKKIRLIP